MSGKFFTPVSAGTMEVTGEVSILGGAVSVPQGAGALSSSSKSVTTTISEIAAAAAGRRFVHIRNNGAATCRIGGAGMTYGQMAIELIAGAEWREEASAAAAWYAITESGTADLVVMVGA